MKVIKYFFLAVAMLMTSGVCAQTAAQVNLLKKQALKGNIQACAKLAAYYRQNWMFDDAETYYTKQIILLNKKKLSNDAMAVARLREQVRKLRDNLPNTSKVQFIDSVVVDKEAFLSEIKMDKENGTIDSYQHFFNVADSTGAMIFLNGFGTKLTYSYRNEAGHLQLFTCDKAGDGWTESHICRGLQEDCDINYPFVNSEGTKMYYSSNSREGIGGYDIYMTRENGDGTGFVEPANLGYPFNSEFNEYLYVEDDVNQLGWLVSDRYQPEGKVCIYIFIPEGLRTSYDYNDPDERKQCQKVAMLHSLKDTWTDKDAVDEALERLAFVRNQSEAAKNVVPKKEFTFVVDDDHVYYYLSDFKSPSAYTSVNNWLARKKHFEDMSAKLEQQRLVYASSSVAERQRMANSLYQLEEQVFELEDLVKQVEKNLRKEELSALGLLR